jgi:hypothetical protein
VRLLLDFISVLTLVGDGTDAEADSSLTHALLMSQAWASAVSLASFSTSPVLKPDPGLLR